MIRVEAALWSRGGPVHGWFQRHPVVGDVLFAVLIMVMVLASVIAVQDIVPEAPDLDLPYLGWIVLGVVPIALRRVLLWWSVGLTVLLMVASVLDYRVWQSLNYTILILAYTVAAYLSFRAAVGATVLLWGTLTMMVVAVIPPAQLGMSAEAALVINYVSAILLFMLGRAIHGRRHKLVELRERARIAEENQQALVTQAINDERRRIARELHDVVAHHIAVMGVLATGARRVLARQPEKADEALATIETTGRATLREMRRLLDVLRSTDEADDEELTPQPSLEAVNALVAQIREAGLPVNLIVEGEPYPLDPGIALTVYRIVQEGLTNTLKHGGPARAGVRIQYSERGLDLEVADTGLGPRSPATESGRVGHGLVGMRERVALYGGTLRTGPRPGGGFRVHAIIPIDTTTAPLGTDTGGNR